MAFLCLDLSTKSTGYCKFSDDGKILKYGCIIPDPQLPPLFKLHDAVNKIKELYADVQNLVIEGIFLGRFNGKANVTTFEYLARLSGAVIYAWISQKYTLPISYKAVEARKLVGIKGTSQKAEIQLWVLREYNFVKYADFNRWRDLMDDLKSAYAAHKLSSGQFKYQSNKLSRLINKETGISEHVADSIVLGRAYSRDRKGGAR